VTSGRTITRLPYPKSEGTLHLEAGIPPQDGALRKGIGVERISSAQLADLHPPGRRLRVQVQLFVGTTQSESAHSAPLSGCSPRPLFHTCSSLLSRTWPSVVNRPREQRFAANGSKSPLSGGLTPTNGCGPARTCTDAPSNPSSSLFPIAFSSFPTSALCLRE
jgi:hypothetical protein